LDVGQRLVIPGLEGVSGVLTSQTLSLGTSFTQLTRQYQVTPQDLSILNRITSPSETIAGVTFILPTRDDQDPLTPLTVVGAHETMLETAIRNGVSPWELIRKNQLTASWDFLPGDILFSGKQTEASLSALPGISDVRLNNLPIIQGETLQVSITAETPLEFSGKFNEEDLQFFSENTEEFHSFHGIHALEEPGVYPLEITAAYPDGSTLTFAQPVLLVAGGYGNEWVNVPEEYLDETVIEAEDAYLKPILTQVTLKKYWEGRFQYPVDEPCLNSMFGQRRDYNNGGLYFYHTGIDFAVCAMNLNIYAPAAGKVVLAEELTIKGKALLIDHGWGVFSGYWHLSEFNVAAGDMVQPGDLIGQIGNTGRSAGPHLHFEIDISGTPVNPETWLLQEFPEIGD
jgi:murein DD-endopeptidase MepM/ murein hydrolase activator NlpD